MTTTTPDLIEHLSDRVLTLTLNRPQARNGIVAGLTVALHDAVQRAATNPAVGVVILQGAGTDFCAGADLNSMASAGTAQRTHTTEELLALGGETALLLQQMPKPTIALIRGAVAGGGLSLASACDFRLADTSAVFAFAYTNIGLSGDFGSLYFLQQLLGVGKAREFALLCQKLTAAEALEQGLLSRVVAPDALDDSVSELAQQLLLKPPYAVGKIKQNLLNAQTLTPAAYLQEEADNFIACRNSDDFKEAMRAFKAKRPPRFGNTES